MTLTFQPCLRPGEDVVAAVVAIYRDVIETSEQKPEAQLRAMLAHPDWRLVVARELGQVIGLSIAWAPQSERFWLLEYLAVAADQHNRGVGAGLFRETVKAFGASRLALVEADAAPAPGSIQHRRLGFYQRLGCRRLGSIAYQLPLTANGAPPPMVLLAHAIASVACVPRETVRGWLTRLYVEVYGQRADDPRIDAMLAGQPDDIPLTPTRPPATP